MALVDVLEIMSHSHPGRPAIAREIKQVIKTVSS